MLLLIANNCWTRSFALGYWLFYFSSVLTQMRKENLCRWKIVSSEYVCCLIYPCPYWGQSIFVTVGSYIVSNQLIAGSIMVSHMKLILVLFLPLRVYYLMRCTPDALWGVIMNSFDIIWSYFGCVSYFGKLCKIWCYWIVCAYLFSTSWICCLLETWVARVQKVTVVPTDCPVL
jgi:hypothetical protein